MNFSSDNGKQVLLPGGGPEAAAEPSRWQMDRGRMASVVLAALLVCLLALVVPISRISRPAVGRALPERQARVVREAAYVTKDSVVIRGTVMNTGSVPTKANLVTAVIAGQDRAALGMQSMRLGPLRPGRWKDFRLEFKVDPRVVATYDVWSLTR